MSANSGEPCCATGVASIRRVAKPKSSLRSTHMPSEVPCKPSHHRCALAIRSAQTAPPTVCAGRPSRCAGGRRIRVLHSDPRRVAVHSQALSSEFILLHCPRHPCLTLPSRGRATSGFASCRPPLMSNVRPRETRRMPASSCTHPRPSRGPSVKLGRRTSAAFQATRPARSGRLPVFAVSEPSVRLKQDAIALLQVASRHPRPRIEHSSAGVASLPRVWRFPRHLGACGLSSATSHRVLRSGKLSARAAHRLKRERPRRVRRRLVHSARSPRH